MAGIAAAGIAYVALTFNPNEYKPQIIKAVKDNKQRNLRLDGDIKLSFFPNIGANLSKVSLSEFRSPQLAAEQTVAGKAGDPGWWARIELPQGEIDLPPAPAASGMTRR